MFRIMVFMAIAALPALAFSQSFTCSTGSPHCVMLTWTAPAPSPTTGVPSNYNIYRGMATGACTKLTVGTPTCPQVGTVVASMLQFLDDSTASNILSEGATYFYVVVSANSSGISDPSTEAVAKIPLSLPGIPQSLGAAVR